ncbi:hypothetical protein HF086_003567 [Spodoptera exigua]|uniref:Uncharacterized protein n=1 Tax=Spodoptera exigua TaxID=7107 RepID=A0A922MMD6_SPOEX|nr:hypothetical protein HF086_003567 [Spodoptera exigua]
MYRYMVWGMVPVALICFYSGIIFYDSPSPPMYVHLLYAGLLKPVFALLIGSLVVSSVIRLEGKSDREKKLPVVAQKFDRSLFLLNKPSSSEETPVFQEFSE